MNPLEAESMRVPMDTRGPAPTHLSRAPCLSAPAADRVRIARRLAGHPGSGMPAAAWPPSS